jgi:hypothetical protein
MLMWLTWPFSVVSRTVKALRGAAWYWMELTMVVSRVEVLWAGLSRLYYFVAPRGSWLNSGYLF